MNFTILLSLSVIFWLIFIYKPKLLFYLFIILIFLPISSFEIYILGGSSILRNIPHFALLLLVIGLILSRKNSIRLFFKKIPNKILLVILAYIYTSIISGLYNNNNFIEIISLSRWIFMIFGTMFVTFTLFDYNDRMKLLKLILFIGIIQFFVTVLQRFLYVYSWQISTGDMVTGTFETYYQLIFFQITCIIIVLSWQLNKKRVLNISPFFLYTIYLGSIALSNSKAALIFLILTSLFLLIISGINIKKMIITTFKMSFLIGLSIYSFNYFYSYSYLRENNYEYLVNSDYVTKYVVRGYSINDLQSLSDRNYIGDYGRIGSIIFNYLKINENTMNYLFGLGPPTLQSSIRFLSNDGVGIERYILGNVISRTLGALGVIGVIIIIILMLILYQWAMKNFMELREWIILRKTIVFFVTILLIYYNILQTFPTAVVLSFIFIPQYRNNYKLR